MTITEAKSVFQTCRLNGVTQKKAQTNIKAQKDIPTHTCAHTTLAVTQLHTVNLHLLRVSKLQMALCITSSSPADQNGWQRAYMFVI